LTEKNSKYPLQSVRDGFAWVVKTTYTLVLAALTRLHKIGSMETDVRWARQLLARTARVLVLAGMSSATNQIPVRASALTYTSMLMFIPFVVILSSVAGRFGYLDLLSRLIISFNDSLSLDLNLDPILGVIEFAQKIDFHRLGVVGSLGLLFTFFLSMSNIELAIDHIWDIRHKRNWWRRIKEYTPFLLGLIGLMVAAGNLVLKYRHFLDSKLDGYAAPRLVHGTAFVLGNVGVIASTWAGLWLLFYLMPNTKVRFFPAALGATLSAAGVYGLMRVLLLFPTLFISRNNYIYGSLAVLPVVLLLIYLFWVIVLYGSAVAFIYQRLYHPRGKVDTSPPTSPAFHAMERNVLAALRAVHDLAGTEAVDGRRLVPLGTVARRLDLTPAAAETLLYPAVDLGLVAKRKTSSGPVYAPRKPLPLVDLTAVHHLLLRLDPEGTGELRVLTAFDELKHTLGILYSTGKRNPPMYLSAALALGEGAEAQPAPAKGPRADGPA
jgi:membrane protein